MIEAAPARGKPVRVTLNGLQMLPGMEFEAWVTLGCRISRITNACAWCLGDWLVYGEQTFGRRYKAALATTSLDYQTLRNYAWVARRFEMSRRRDALSFQHHAEVAALPEPQQDLWLLRAERSGWSRNELRRRLTAQRQTRRGSGVHDEVRISIQIATARERRWRQAASAADQTLSDWVAQVVDEAADAALAGHSPALGADQLELEKCGHIPPGTCNGSPGPPLPRPRHYATPRRWRQRVKMLTIRDQTALPVRKVPAPAVRVSGSDDFAAIAGAVWDQGTPIRTWRLGLFLPLVGTGIDLRSGSGFEGVASGRGGTEFLMQEEARLLVPSADLSRLVHVLAPAVPASAAGNGIAGCAEPAPALTGSSRLSEGTAWSPHRGSLSP